MLSVLSRSVEQGELAANIGAFTHPNDLDYKVNPPNDLDYQVNPPDDLYYSVNPPDDLYYGVNLGVIIILRSAGCLLISIAK